MINAEGGSRRTPSSFLVVKLKRGALFRDEEAAHIGALQLQQLHFFVDPPGVACQASACADDAVTGDDDGNLVVPDCAAHGLRGHFLKPLLFGKLPCNLAVGRGLAVRNLQEDLPHRLTEG